MAKTVTLDWDSFFAGDISPKQEAPSLVGPGVATAVMMAVHPATAQAAMSDRIIHAFDPLISAVQAVSYPVSFLGMAAGMLLISVGQRHRGISMVKWSAIGYLGMQLVPSLMSLVADVGKAMR